MTARKTNARKVASNEVVSFKDTCMSFDDSTVADMVTRIEESFARRDIFEAANGVSLTSDNSYTRERDRILGDKRGRNARVAVSRLFLALGVEPSAVIERKVSESSMFNAKALKKVTEIARFACGAGERLERVTRAFIACALIASDRGIATATNATNRKFLCGQDFGAQVTDADLIAHLDELRHRAMTSGAETQSSQARNVLDVLGLGRIESIEKPRDAITINAQHAFYSDFRAAFMK